MSQKIFHPLKPKDAPAEGATDTSATQANDAIAQQDPVGEFSLTGDALESYAHTAAKSSEGELTSAEFQAATREPEQRIDPPNFIADRYPDPKDKVIPPLEIKDGAPTVDSLAARVGAVLDIPKERILRSIPQALNAQPTMRGSAFLDVSGQIKDVQEPAAAPDWFSAFLSECCIVDAGASVPTPDLRGVFEIWYKAKHEGSPPLAQFWKMLAEKGYESDRGSTGSFRLRRGLKLAEHSRAYQEFLQSEAAAAPPAQPASFTEFVKKHQPSMSMFRWKEGHWLIMSGLENALTMRESLILAPPRTGRSMLATIFFPAWLMLVKGKQNVVVVCESATAAKDRHREILEKFPAIEPFVGLALGKTVDAQPRLQFRGPYTSFTGQGFDAIVIDPPRGSDPELASHYAVLSSRLAPGGFIATITNREGEGDFAQALINFGGGWGQRLQAHLFPDMIPADIDRTTDTYFWQYNQGLPSYYGAKDIAAAPNSPFKKFLADCLTPAASWQLQLIFGRLHNAEPHAAERCYVHIGRGVNGKTTLLNAVARVFQAVRLTSDLKTDAKLLLREPRMAILECADEASDVWLKTMSTSGSQVHITSNHDIKALDKGALRRVKIFAWEKTISEPDPDMEDKIASDPDFLIWLAEGLRRYQAGEREIP